MAEGLSASKLRKQKYKTKLVKLLQEYKNILVLGIENVGSNQMQQVRIALRGKGVMLMGKNTVIRRIITDHLEHNPLLEVVLPHIRGNVGFCFTNEDLSEIRKLITENKVPAAARSGLVAPLDVFIPPGPTGLDPGQTSFFQALNIATKISRGAIEILNTVHLIRKGEKVTSSAVALLTKLGKKPFFFGVQVVQVYENGDCYDPSILDLDENAKMRKFFNGVGRCAMLSLGAQYPTLASIPHSFARAFQKLVFVGISADYIFEEAQPFKDFLENPDAFKAEAPAEDKKEEEEAPAADDDDDDDDSDAGEEEGFSLFGGDDDEEGY